jgi:hypothetical protein
MPAEFRRKLYTRGSSFETTIPMPLLFKLDLSSQKYDVVFTYDAQKDRWYVDFEEAKGKGRTGGSQ